MKKATFLLLACIAMFSLESCQIYSVVKDATDKEEGRIITNDGTEYVGRVKMPKCNTKTIKMKTTDGKKVKLANTDIAVLGVWKKTHTDKPYALVCHPYSTNKLFSTKKRKDHKPQWMAIKEQGDHLEIYSCGYKYSIPSDGILKITSVQNGNIIYIARKTNDTTGRLIGYVDGNSKKFTRTQLMEYLSDDPDLCAKLESKEIEATDFNKIVNTYNPSK